VTERPLKNVAASVRQRLMNSAKASGRPFQEVLQYFATERFLYRLSQSPTTRPFWTTPSPDSARTRRRPWSPRSSRQWSSSGNSTAV